MKNKFMLHGGMLSYDNPHNVSFFKEFTKDLKDGDKVLFIGFARREPAKRLEIFERDKGYILAHTDKEIIVENAELDTLIEQAQKAKAVFVTGGDPAGLQSDLNAQPEFLNTLKGKVYAGSSSGAMVASTYYAACSGNEVREGLGWLPIRVMVHYGNPEFDSTEETLAILQQYPDDLELVALPECEWVVKEVEL